MNNTPVIQEFEFVLTVSGQLVQTPSAQLPTIQDVKRSNENPGIGRFIYARLTCINERFRNSTSITCRNYMVLPHFVDFQSEKDIAPKALKLVTNNFKTLDK